MPRKAPVPTTGAILSLEEAERLQEAHGARVDIAWGGKDRPWFDWQTRMLNCTCDEIGLLGGKSGGKSTVMRAWLISGNPDKPDYDSEGQSVLVNQSYIYHPDFLGLILRKNEDDLTDFIARASRMWASLGAEYVRGHFRFPSGARIDAGHLKDSTSWQKYIGIEYQRIAIDEAGLIPEFNLFEELRSCMRSPYPELRCQVVLASNAGGPGTGWLIDRFMKARDEFKQIIAHDQVITETYTHPFTMKEEKRTRIWIFSTIKDNPVMRDTPYAVTLISLTDPKKREAYFEGHWDALYGSYFGDLFRPDGPVFSNKEPDNANHVVPEASVKLLPWWHRSIGMDWGYAHESAIMWACQDANGRIYIYREIVASQASPERLGYEIAMASRAELELLTSHSMVLHLSHDAFSTRAGDKSIAELIAVGIQRVLGPNSVHLPDLMIKRIKEAYEADSYRYEDMQARDKAIEGIRLQRKLGITIRIAEKTGIIGWQHVRETLRWQTIGERNAQFEQSIFMRLLREAPDKAEEYARLFRDLKPEILPKLQILRERCPRLIDAIPRAQHEDGQEAMDKAHFKGRDSVDGLLYLIMGMRDEMPPEPFEEFRAHKLETIQQQQPSMSVDDLVRINMGLEAQWKEKNTQPAPFTPPRQARLSRLIMQGKYKLPSKVYERI